MGKYGHEGRDQGINRGIEPCAHSFLCGPERPASASLRRVALRARPRWSRPPSWARDRRAGGGRHVAAGPERPGHAGRPSARTACRRRRSTASCGRRRWSTTSSTRAATSPAPGRPGAAAGTSETPRSNLLAYNINTGELTRVRPGRQRSGALGRCLAGQDPRSTSAAASPRWTGRPATGSPPSTWPPARWSTNFAPPVNYDVYSVAATNTTVFAGGDFQGVGTKARGYLASFNASNGALLDWTPAGRRRQGLGASRSTPTATKLAVAGQFTTLNGSANPGYGLGHGRHHHRREPARWRSTRWSATAARRPAITSLTSDGDNVYGGGYTFGAGGTLEGIFGASWDGGTAEVRQRLPRRHLLGAPARRRALRGRATPTTAATSAASRRPPTWTFYRGLAFGKTATGTAMPDPYGYANFTGQPSSSLAGLVPVDQRGHLHRHEPGPVVGRAATTTTS